MSVIKRINVDGVEYDIQGKELTKVTYAELKAKRDNGELVEGHLYRITDYEFTTVQVETKSAGHVFDIIVLATAENQLSELARAIQHEDDTYFDGIDLGAWELWYDLDNDTTKYAWADAENGKGVIYRMIDENHNDCPYDFKNALFYNTKLEAGGTTSDKYYYTFSYLFNGVLDDHSVKNMKGYCYGNIMGVYMSSGKKASLNKNVFKNIYSFSRCCNNIFRNDCYNNTFGGSCYDNTFGDSCYSNTFGNSCYNNTFGNSCYSNTFGNSCYFNIFGYACYSNRSRGFFKYNTFKNVCYSNTFGDSCYSNTFGNSCSNVTFGDNCSENVIGSYVTHRKIDHSKTSIVEADEYFDDGSGQLVPVKHPDLSTQPSILPYKFMGQYVYEQLIPITSLQRDYYITEDETGIKLSGIVFLGAVAVYKIGKRTHDADIPENILGCVPAQILHDAGGLHLTPTVNLDYYGDIKHYRVIYTYLPDDGSHNGY